jgi:transcriptional regulator with XRE-family HTH domain
LEARPPDRDDRESSRIREARPEFRNYVSLMPAESKPELDLRRVRFAALVDRALRAANDRGMTIEQIEKATDVGNSTFYTWRSGKWNRDPVQAKVRSFCEGLGIDIDEAYRALGWATTQLKRRKPPEPMLEDPDVRALMHKLSDPKTPPATKELIRRTIRALID